MKRASATLALLLCFLAIGSAQEEKAIEPEFLSVFYFLGASGQALNLERQIPDEIVKGGKLLLMVPGEKSPVRLNAGSKMQFIIRVTEGFDKATSTMQLMRFEINDGMRQLAVKMPGKNGEIENGLNFKATKYGNSSLKLDPSPELVPGEYCLTRTTTIQGFCFGVDAAGTGQVLP